MLDSSNVDDNDLSLDQHSIKMEIGNQTEAIPLPMADPELTDSMQTGATDDEIAALSDEEYRNHLFNNITDDITRQAAHNAHIPFPVRMVINQKISGVIIGKGGIKIKDISAQCNVKCYIANEILDIFGKGANCSKAVRMCLVAILEKLTEIKEHAGNEALGDGDSLQKSSQVVLRMICPDQLVGRLLGRQGSHIKSIIKRTDTIIVISNERDLHQLQQQHATFTRNPKERLITIRGANVESVSQAESLISDTMRVGFLLDDCNTSHLFASKNSRQCLEVNRAAHNIGEMLNQLDNDQHIKDPRAMLTRLDTEDQAIQRSVYQARAYLHQQCGIASSAAPQHSVAWPPSTHPNVPPPKMTRAPQPSYAPPPYNRDAFISTAATRAAQQTRGFATRPSSAGGRLDAMALTIGSYPEPGVTYGKRPRF